MNNSQKEHETKDGALISALKPKAQTNTKREESIRLWNNYNSQNKPYQLREQLIKKYAHLVKWVVGRFPYIESADFDKDDLLGYGTIGLIEAVDRFDPKQKCSFETFAITRIKGEILDFLRARDFLTRNSRQRVKKYQQAAARLEASLSRAPTEEELRKELNVDKEELRKAQKEAAALVFSLDATEGYKPFEDTSTTLIDNIASDDISQEEKADRGILREKLAQSIDKLPQRERLIMALYHYQKLTFKEIGEVLDISESRVSQLHMKCLQKLRAMMQGFEV